MRCSVVVALGVVLGTAACRVGPVDEATLTTRAPARLALGRPASTDDIRVWDIDVNGRGVGLPPGRGSTADGARLYADKCAACHGATGEGTPAASQLIAPRTAAVRARRNISTHWPFAPPLFDYIRRTMPPNRPGSLPDDEVYALMAYLLAENGITTANAQDAQSLTAVIMPGRDRFVPDDRRGGPEVK